jgi:hypothetical protein
VKIYIHVYIEEYIIVVAMRVVTGCSNALELILS